jgi:hypothetical protein
VVPEHTSIGKVLTPVYFNDWIGLASLETMLRPSDSRANMKTMNKIIMTSRTDHNMIDKGMMMLMNLTLKFAVSTGQ